MCACASTAGMSSRRSHHSITPSVCQAVSCFFEIAEGLCGSVSPTKTKRASTPRALSCLAVSTNSLIPLSHNIRDASITTGIPDGSGVGEKIPVSTPDPLISRIRSSLINRLRINMARSSLFCSIRRDLRLFRSPLNALQMAERKRRAIGCSEVKTYPMPASAFTTYGTPESRAASEP